MIREKWTRKIAINEYLLYDKFTCEKCKLMHTKEIIQVDKNTDKTKAILDRKQQQIEDKKVDDEFKKLGRDYGNPND